MCDHAPPIITVKVESAATATTALAHPMRSVMPHPIYRYINAVRWAKRGRPTGPLPTHGLVGELRRPEDTAKPFRKTRRPWWIVYAALPARNGLRKRRRTSTH